MKSTNSTGESSDSVSDIESEDSLIIIDIKPEDTSPLLNSRGIPKIIASVAIILKTLIGNKNIEVSFLVNINPDDNLLVLLSYLAALNKVDITFKAHKHMVEVKVGKQSPQIWRRMLDTLNAQKNSEVEQFLNDYQSGEQAYNVALKLWKVFQGQHELQYQLQKMTAVSMCIKEFSNDLNEPWAMVMKILNQLPTAKAKKIEFKIDSEQKKLYIAFKDFSSLLNKCNVFLASTEPNLDKWTDNNCCIFFQQPSKFFFGQPTVSELFYIDGVHTHGKIVINQDLIQTYNDMFYRLGRYTDTRKSILRSLNAEESEHLSAMLLSKEVTFLVRPDITKTCKALTEELEKLSMKKMIIKEFCAQHNARNDSCLPKCSLQ